MQQLGAGTIVYGEDVETLIFDWGVIKILSEPAITGSQRMSFGMVVLTPGKGHERHNHPGCDEIIYVMSGEGEQMIDDCPSVHVRTGASIYIPADIYHATLNTGWEPLRLIIVYTPPSPERALRNIPGCTVLAPGQLPS